MENDWQLLHLGMVVRDVDKAIEFYRSLGMTVIKPPMMWSSDDYPDYEMYGSRPAGTIRNRLGFVQKGSVIIELVQPVEGDSIHQQYLDRHGEGINHIGFAVDDLNKEKARMAERGIADIGGRKAPVGGLAWFDTGKVGEVFLELVQRMPGQKFVWEV